MTQAVTDGLNPLAESALCAWFAGESIQRAVPWVVATGAVIPTPYTKAAALALTALQYGCSFKPDLTPEQVDGSCWEVASPTVVEFYEPVDGQAGGYWACCYGDKAGVQPMNQVLEIIQIVGYVDITNPNSGLTSRYIQAEFRFADGSTAIVTNDKGYDLDKSNIEYLRVFKGSQPCLKPAPGANPPPPPAPITQYSAELNCNVEAVLNGFEFNANGTASPSITFRTDQTPTSGNSVGDTPPVVSGCNWFGDLVWVAPDNPCNSPVLPLPPNPPSVPIQPQPGICPDPCPPIEPEPVAESTYLMIAPCNKDAQGNPLEFEKVLPASAGLPAISARLEALSEQMSQALDWKTPICSDKPNLLGDWVTIRFESLEPSPQGTRPLRKLFRYRSQSAYDLGQIAAYWENFQWNAGPVCIQHKGGWWGTPQCWAQNADEGKRVIRFAGLEAGIDPDAIGEWVVSGSSDPRFGMPGTMRVAKVQGLEWVTSRQGPSGLPLLTVDP